MVRVTGLYFGISTMFCYIQQVNLSKAIFLLYY